MLIGSSSPATTTLANKSALDAGFFQLVGYISLLNLILGVLGNLICFAVFVSTAELRHMSFVVYLTYCSVANIVSLFEWNLDHFVEAVYGINLEKITLPGCRIVSFLQYFSLQSSAFFLSWMCIDRYVTVTSMPGSLASRLPFSTARSAHFWSLLTIVLVFCLNVHILIFNGYYDPPEWRNMTVHDDHDPNRTIIVAYLYQNPDFKCGRYSDTFNLWPLWDMVHLYVYTVLPFCIMMTFNGLLIVKTLLPNKNLRSSATSSASGSSSYAAKANQDKARLTRSLLAITMSFLIMTVPADIAFGYFANLSDSFPWVFNMLDCFAFAHQAVLFWNCFCTNKKFRNRVMYFISRLFAALHLRKMTSSVRLSSNSDGVELSLQRLTINRRQTRTSI